jgi:GTPase involved in cell partitioning and DNA repair
MSEKAVSWPAFNRALSKIAEYPFTTLTVNIGKVKFIDDFSMTVADIPDRINF